MSHDDHHLEYDEGTLLKLELFERYLESWLPVFLHSQQVNTINIFDFFSGPGGDSVGQKGSPLRAVDVVKRYIDQIGNKKINAFFNDNKRRCVQKLGDAIDITAVKNIEISIDCLDYEDAFKKYFSLMQFRFSANFLFIDPFGLLRPEIFRKISTLTRTDFLFFLPAQFIARFKDTPEFEQKWPGIGRLSATKPIHVPDAFCREMLRPLVPSGYHLTDFTIRKVEKGSVHGLIFGSGNILGLEKFLDACWKLEPQTGVRNFSIDGDLPTANEQMILPGIDAGSKLRNFKAFLRQEILAGRVKTNEDAYYLSLRKACRPSHAREVIKELKAEGRIANAVPVSYDTVVRNKKIKPIVLAK